VCFKTHDKLQSLDIKEMDARIHARLERPAKGAVRRQATISGNNAQVRSVVKIHRKHPVLSFKTSYHSHPHLHLFENAMKTSFIFYASLPVIHVVWQETGTTAHRSQPEHVAHSGINDDNIIIIIM
jgi:hypothetical protein